MIKFAPSILSADFSILGEEIKKIEKSGCDYIHLDVMDGSFVPNISIGIPVLKSIRKITSLTFDVHLMIENPREYIKAFSDAGADIITIHVEASKHLEKDISLIKSLGKRVGIALNPATSLSSLDWVLSKCDMVLVMSVNPGFGGQEFIPFTLDKLRELKKIIYSKGLNVDIQVDGGIEEKNVKTIIDAGANIIVSGSAFFNSKDKQEFVRKICQRDV